MFRRFDKKDLIAEGILSEEELAEDKPKDNKTDDGKGEPEEKKKRKFFGRK